MPVFSMTTVHIAVDEVNLSGFANQLALSFSGQEKDITTFASGGFEQKMVGLGTFALNASGFQDYVAPSPDALTNPSALGGFDTFSVSVPGTTAGDVAYFGQARSTSLTPLDGAVGDVAAFSAQWGGTAKLRRGVMLHPVAARTSTGNGTTVAMAGPSATQALAAAFHVHSVTGTGTITFVVETDDNSGMTTPTTRITSSAFAAVGHEVASVNGAFASETHVRVRWTISGFTSVTFSVAAGIGPQ